MITIFTSEKLLTPENRGIVHPLLFDLHYYEQTHKDVLDKYKIVQDPSKSDVFIFPVSFTKIRSREYYDHYRDLYKLALVHQKKIMVYSSGDYGKTFHNTCIIPWRNGGFKSTNDPSTVIIPSFINDPMRRKDFHFKLLKYSIKPKISFTGFATNSRKVALKIFIATLKNNILRKLGKNNSDPQEFYNLALERLKYLKKLEKSLNIQTDFIYRNRYRAGAQTSEDRERTTAQFFKNLNNAPYTFCMRGAGNFSVRFYESLACGRIPVLIDTDVELPLEKILDWDKHICRVLPEDDVNKKLLDFHNSHNAQTFKELQESNRQLYEQFLVRHRFFYHLHDILKETI